MGSITIQVIGDALVGTKSKTYSFLDADINRLVAWAASNPPGPGDVPLAVTPALIRWADNFISETKTKVLAYERGQITVAPIVVT